MKIKLFSIPFFIFCAFVSSYAQEKYINALRKDKIDEIRNFVAKSKYNQDIAMFIDFRIPSGKYRFFVYDLRKNTILAKGVVAHGSGSVQKGHTDLKFSNIEGSYQSSLGKYEISSLYYGQFGKSYRLKGLEKTNSNALQRAIVLHALSCVPDEETTSSVCLSLGCPMLSEKFFKKVAAYIDGTKKPIILYAFY